MGLGRHGEGVGLYSLALSSGKRICRGIEDIQDEIFLKTSSGKEDMTWSAFWPSSVIPAILRFTFALWNQAVVCLVEKGGNLMPLPTGVRLGGKALAT